MKKPHSSPSAATSLGSERISSLRHSRPNAAETLPADEAADLIGELGTHATERVLHHIDDENELVLRDLLSYPEDTAGGLMVSEFLCFRSGQKIRDVIDDLQENREEYTYYNVQYMYVVDDAGRLAVENADPVFAEVAVLAGGAGTQGRQAVAPGQCDLCRDVCVIPGCVIERQPELLLIGVRRQDDVVEDCVRRGKLLHPDFDIQVSACQGTDVRQLVCLVGTVCLRLVDLHITGRQLLRFKPYPECRPGVHQFPAQPALQVAGNHVTRDVVDFDMLVEVEPDVRAQCNRFRLGQRVAGYDLEIVQVPTLQVQPVFAMAPVGQLRNAAIDLQGQVADVTGHGDLPGPLRLLHIQRFTAQGERYGYRIHSRVCLQLDRLAQSGLAIFRPLATKRGVCDGSSLSAPSRTISRPNAVETWRSI